MKKEKKEVISYRQLSNFFLPLAVLPMMIALSHTGVNSALARLPRPELNLAVFTVVKSVTNILNAPTIMSRQLFSALVDSKDNYNLVSKFAWAMTGFLFFLLIILAITPLGEFILIELMGLSQGPEVNLAVKAFYITAFLPLVVMFRNSYHGMLTGLQKTKLIVPGTIVRLIALGILLFWAVRTESISGVIAGCLAWIIGILMEGIFVFGIIKRNYGSSHAAATEMPVRNDKKLTVKMLFKFFLPLAVTIMLTMLLQPIIQGGIARSSTPVQSLAAYGVAWTLVMFFGGPLRMMNQLAVVYAKDIDHPNWTKIKRFSLLCGIIISIMILIFSITPIGNWVLLNLIGISAEMVVRVKVTMLAFSLFPIIRSLRESYWGLLMNRQTTSMIGYAKLINLLFLVLGILIGFRLNQKIDIEPAMIGAFAFTLGEIIETIVIWRYVCKDGFCKKIKKLPQFSE